MLPPTLASPKRHPYICHHYSSQKCAHTRAQTPCTYTQPHTNTHSRTPQTVAHIHTHTHTVGRTHTHTQHTHSRAHTTHTQSHSTHTKRHTHPPECCCDSLGRQLGPARLEAYEHVHGRPATSHGRLAHQVGLACYTAAFIYTAPLQPTSCYGHMLTWASLA